MKKTSFLIAMLVCSLLINCDYERVGEADPTSFSGKVIFSDTGEPFNGSIAVAGYRIIFPVDRTITDKRQELDAEGKFDFTFEGNIEIDFFTITIFPPLTMN